MAGNYPDVPAPRMAYDRDGSTAFRLNTDNTITTLSSAQALTMNDESSSGVSTPSMGGTWTVYFGVIFPQARDISGVTISGSNGGDYISDLFQTSVDTTNGLDGTWVTQIASPTIIGSAVTPTYRTAINSVAVTNIQGVRYRARKVLGAASGTQTCYALHLYGSISNKSGVDALRIWHPTLNEPLDENNSADGAYFDWGNIQRNTTSDKQFRIKNESLTLTANGIIISQQTPTDTTPSVNTMFSFSDGGAFAASIDIGNLAPGAISPIITKRFTRPSNAVLSLW